MHKVAEMMADVLQECQTTTTDVNSKLNKFCWAITSQYISALEQNQQTIKTSTSTSRMVQINEDQETGSKEAVIGAFKDFFFSGM